MVWLLAQLEVVAKRHEPPSSTIVLDLYVEPLFHSYYGPTPGPRTELPKSRVGFP